MRTALQSFIVAKEADGRAKRTIQDYHRCLDPFVEWCCNQPPDTLARDDVRQYVARLRRRDLSNATIAIHIRNVRTFLRWCWSEGLAGENLALAVSAPRTCKREELPLSHNEIKLLVFACSGALARRDHALILFLLDTGMRVSEVVLVKRDDVHTNGSTGWIRVYAPKTYEYRFVILGQRTLVTLLEYLDTRDDDVPELWVGRQGALTTRGVSHALKRRARAVGLEKRVHPHIFRKTFATNWLDNDGDSERLRVLMGWSPETLTQMLEIYISSKRTHLEAAHAKASPVDNLPW